LVEKLENRERLTDRQTEGMCVKEKVTGKNREVDREKQRKRRIEKMRQRDRIGPIDRDKVTD
jgi:hypothetical protein